MPRGRPEAQIDVRINERPAVAGLRRLSSALGSVRSTFGPQVAAVGTAFAGFAASVGAAATAVGVLSLRALSAADSLDKVALRLGTTAGFIDRMHFAANRSGGSITMMDTALTALSRRAAAQPALFERWGVATRDANGHLLNTEQLTLRVADRIQNAGSQAERLAIAQDLMSEAGRKLVPMLQGGADGMQAMLRQADELGVVITEFERTAAAQLADRLGILEEQTTALQRSIGAVLQPAVEALGVEASRVIAAMREWVVVNREWLQSGIIEGLSHMATFGVPAVSAAVAVLGKNWLSLRLSINITFTTMSAFFAGTSAGIKGMLAGLSAVAHAVGADGLGSAIDEAETAVGRLRDRFVDDMGDSAQATADAWREFGRLDSAIASFAARTQTGLRRAIQAIKDIKAEVADTGFGGLDDTEGSSGLSLGLDQVNTALNGVSLTAEKSMAAFGGAITDAEIRTASLQDAIGSLGGTVLNSLGSGLASALQSVFVGAEGPLEALRSMVGETLMLIGRMVVQIGTAAVLLSALGPIPGFNAFAIGAGAGAAAIAGGAAMIAVGSAIKGGASSGGGASGIGSTPATSGGASAPDSFSPIRPGESIDRNNGALSGGAQNITVNVDFRGPVTNPRRTAREIADATAGALAGI